MSATQPAATAQRARRGVIIAYGIIAVVGAAFFALSFQYDAFNDRGLVGPGLLPRIGGAIVALCGIGLVVQELRGGTVLAGDSGMDGGEREPMERKAVLKLVAVFALITAAVFLSPLLGLIPALAILVLVLTAVIERMPIVPSIISAVVAGVVAHLLFVVVLQVPLPLGVFEGLLP